MVKRVFLFVATNIAIMVMVSIVLAVLGQLGVFQMAGGQGRLLILCAVWGFGAALVSLLISRWMAKRAMGVKLVDGRTGNADLDWLHNKVGQLAQQANLPMPEVGYLRVARGERVRHRALEEAQPGRGLDRPPPADGQAEVEGVLAHEVSHIANGDMVTMTLIQGVVNAFVLYLSHIVAMIARNALSSRDERRPVLPRRHRGTLVFIAAQIAFGLLGSMITAWFSRQREFRADAGGAGLAGQGAMVGALRRLKSFQGQVDNDAQPGARHPQDRGRRRPHGPAVDAPAARGPDRGARGAGLGPQGSEARAATSAARSGRSATSTCSSRACAPPPRGPRPSRVGIPAAAVKLPSEAPPTRAAPSSKPRSPARRRAGSKRASEAGVGSRGGRSKPPSTVTPTPGSAGR